MMPVAVFCFAIVQPMMTPTVEFGSQMEHIISRAQVSIQTARGASSSGCLASKVRRQSPGYLSVDVARH
eukprot:5575598-Lingulodinium_polyedra.AAC.1